MGISGVDQASSLDILVMQDDIISYIENVNRNIDCSKEALALDLIDRIGPGGIFIDQMHTAEHFRSELWFPQLLDRSYYEEWQEQGAESMAERCQRRKQEILSKDETEPMLSDMEREFGRIVRSAEKELKK